ncbi:MAG: ADP-glyceromanno-heptose 6-epimerase, partial [Candidatus Eremiobacteraeota bacterium]|nr:ADP-glyceromanno-heptose 6-epimerase [Candidatus Eremiobacteraeota bacterium]
RILVTGGAGLIGSALIWALNCRGIDNILVADFLGDSEKWKNLAPLRFHDYLEADDFQRRISEKPSAFKNVRTVLHLGACSSTLETDAAYLVRNNYEFTKCIAHWAVDRKMRMLYASSAATYGALEKHLDDTCDLESLRPLNMYAFSKHRFDLYAKQTGLLDKITGLKYFNVFGPNEDHKGEMRSLVNKGFAQIKSSGLVKLFRSQRPEYRDGEQRRDFLYVKDAVDMTLHLAEHDALGVYNIGSGKAQTWLELVRPIFAAMQLPEQIEFIDMPAPLAAKYQYSTQASIERLRASGYDREVTPLGAAVGDYVKNYLIPDARLDPQAAQSRKVN